MVFRTWVTCGKVTLIITRKQVSHSVYVSGRDFPKLSLVLSTHRIIAFRKDFQEEYKAGVSAADV